MDSTATILDSLALGDSDDITAQNSSILLIEDAHVRLANGSMYPATLGTLSLGAPAPDQTFQGDGDGPDYHGTFVPSYFEDHQVTGSASFGLHSGWPIQQAKSRALFNLADMIRIES